MVKASVAGLHGAKFQPFGCEDGKRLRLPHSRSVPGLLYVQATSPDPGFNGPYPGADSTLGASATLDKCAQYIVDARLVIPALVSKPVQHVGIDLNIDVKLAQRESLPPLAPIRLLVHIVGVGRDARFQFILYHGIDLGPIRAALASTALCF